MTDDATPEEEISFDDLEENSEIIEEITTIESELINLNFGEDLSMADCRSITRSDMTRVIVLAGEVESGKTTLLASIYNHFLNGPYANCLFAGSSTLLAFERCCHDARLASGRHKTKTERTKHKGEFRFLHLKIKDKNSELSQNILFTDVSGELYRGVRDSAEECKKHLIFNRADHFVLLIDGEKVCDPILRGKSISDATHLLRQCIDSEMLNNKSIVDVVFTKLDHLTVEFNKEPELKDALKKIVQGKFIDTLMKKIPNMSFHHIASRVDAKLDSGIKMGSGVISLFKSWIVDAPSSRKSLKQPAIDYNISRREIDKFHRPYHKDM